MNGERDGAVVGTEDLVVDFGFLDFGGGFLRILGGLRWILGRF